MSIGKENSDLVIGFFFLGGGYLEVSLGHEYEPKVSMIMVTLEVGTEETSVCE